MESLGVKESNSALTDKIFCLDLPANVKDYLFYIRESIKTTLPVTAIYLFGSYAKGDWHENSDLDLFIVTSDKSKRRADWITEVDYAIERGRGIPVEIIVNYDDDFNERSKGINTIEREVIDTGVNIL